VVDYSLNIMSFQCMLEMSVVHVPPQMWWQGVPHPRAGSRQNSVAEAVVCAWNDTYSLRHRSKMKAASIGSEWAECRTLGTISNDNLTASFEYYRTHVSKPDIAVRNRNYHTATGNHMPYEITQCYLPPGRGDFSCLYPSRSWYSI